MDRNAVLHEATEPKGSMFEPHKVYSMLDILGGGDATCDTCGRWQRFSAITPQAAQQDLALFGWTFRDGKDFCPKCSGVPMKKQK
jgi:hypothetical protein